MSKKTSTNLVIEFQNQRSLALFKTWLCEQGEQDYWQWMEFREREEPKGNITALRFNFDFSMPGCINTEAGRLDKDTPTGES